ncbi:MAG: hypothetical protein KAX49_13580 [Halanaerobiales bacterium]|nr:hypothetical protein [Halanaerobiales bacterium]
MSQVEIHSQEGKYPAKGECPEREKGASPPDFMPAIMGWISQEEQRQRASDLLEAAEEIVPNGKVK